MAPARRTRSGTVIPRFAALRVPNYRKFITGQAVSLIGSWTETIAQGVLVLNLTHSALELGIVASLRYLPVLVLSPYAGLIVDRCDRRRTLIATQILLGALSAAFASAVLAGLATIGAVYVLAIAFGVLTAFDNPARMALIPELVDREQLHGAITLNSTLANVGRGLGPVVAAVLIATWGVAWCFVVNAISFAFVVIALFSIDVSQLRPEPTVRRANGQLRDALRVVFSKPNLRGPLLMMAVVGTFTYEFEVSFPAFATGSLSGGPTEYAALTAAFGIGAVLAGLLLSMWPQTGLIRMIAITVAYGVLLITAALMPTALAANIVVVFVGAASIAFLTTGNSTIQLAAPPGMRGRVTSLWTMAFIGSTPLGALAIGAIGQIAGGRSTILVAGAACVLAAIVGASVRGRHRRGGGMHE